jgi:hypothetical protein
MPMSGLSRSNPSSLVVLLSREGGHGCRNHPDLFHGESRYMASRSAALPVRQWACWTCPVLWGLRCLAWLAVLVEATGMSSKCTLSDRLSAANPDVAGVVPVNGESNAGIRVVCLTGRYHS